MKTLIITTLILLGTYASANAQYPNPYGYDRPWILNKAGHLSYFTPSLPYGGMTWDYPIYDYGYGCWHPSYDYMGYPYPTYGCGRHHHKSHCDNRGHYSDGLFHNFQTHPFGGCRVGDRN